MENSIERRSEFGKGHGDRWFGYPVYIAFSGLYTMHPKREYSVYKMKENAS